MPTGTIVPGLMKFSGVLRDATGKPLSGSAVGFTYGGSSCLGGTSPCYNVGRMTGMTDGAGSEAWSYDQMGRVWTDQRTTNSLSKSFYYVYNLDGTIHALTYPSTRGFTYSYNSASQPTGVAGSGAYSYAQSAVYTPAGQLNTLTLGGNNSWPKTLTETYNNRLQPLNITVASSGTTVLNLTYGFNPGSSDNGNVMGITNNLNSSRSETLTYDSLNRILTAGTSAWSQNYSGGIDQYGNLKYVTSTGGRPP